MAETCFNRLRCTMLEEYLAGKGGINTLEDILLMLQHISDDDDARSGVLSCRLVFGKKCRMHPEHPKITDGRIQRALKKL